jgi:hypothetical protein
MNHPDDSKVCDNGVIIIETQCLTLSTVWSIFYVHDVSGDLPSSDDWFHYIGTTSVIISNNSRDQNQGLINVTPRLPNGLFPLSFPTECLFNSLISPFSATRPVHNFYNREQWNSESPSVVSSTAENKVGNEDDSRLGYRAV